MKLSLSIPVALCAVLCACSESDSQAAAPRSLPTWASEDVAVLELGDAKSVHTVGDLILASQVSATDLERAKEMGVRSVIDLRGPEEDRGFDEPAKVAELGLEYHNPWFSSADGLTDVIFETGRQQLSDPEQRPLLIHCSSANRAGAVWVAYRVLDEGVPLETALAEAQRMGLTKEPLVDKARAYVMSAR